MKILVLEDERISREVIKQIMLEYGDVETSVDGTEALELYKKSVAEGAKYDLVCLDIMVPGIDGQQVLREIRDFEERDKSAGLKQRSKVVMISALSDRDNLFSAFTEGQAEAYIFKPFTKKKIKDTLSNIGLIG